MDQGLFAGLVEDQIDADLTPRSKPLDGWKLDAEVVIERKPVETSGLRIGTPAVTTRGMEEPEMKMIASWISSILSNKGDAAAIAKIRGEVGELCQQFPLP